MTPTLMSDDAVPAWVALGEVLASLTRPTPCQIDPAPFTSDHPAERRGAAHACRAACPAIAACKRYADAGRETWLVWAGEDRTPTTTRKPKTTGAAA